MAFIRTENLNWILVTWFTSSPLKYLEYLSTFQANQINDNMQTTWLKYPTFNPHRSCLLRCLHSIYNRTPPKLLHEIILVNDNSTDAGLYEPIESYVAENFGGKVKIFVNQGRKGLIVTRMEGAKRAGGDVIVFLDSHMEVSWLWENSFRVGS